MSQWAERMQSHQVFTELAEIGKFLESANEACQQDATTIAHWDRANAVVAHVRTVFNQTDPLLVVAGNLNNIASYLQQARAEISGFVSNKNAAHWNNAQTHFDNCLAQLAAIPRQSASGIEDMREVAANYRTATAAYLNDLKVDGDEVAKEQATLEKRISEATTEIAAQKQRLDTAIATFQQQFSDAQQVRQNEFAAAEQSRVQAAAKAEHERQSSFDEAEEQRAETSEKADSDVAKEHAAVIDSLNNGTKAIIDTMEGLKAHAQKLIGIITDTGMAHGYQKTANEERSRSALWKGVAFSSLVLWITVGVVFFYFTYDKDLTWATVARQTLISMPFILLAGFAALQVTRHQKNERRFRQAELELASIDPFLATLDDGERNQVKREFAVRYFGQHEADSKHDGADPKLLDLAGSLAKTLNEIQQAVRK